MPIPSAPPIVLADDLSGAAEVAATLGAGARVVLWDDAAPPTKVNPGTVLDLDTRSLQPEAAGARTLAALAALGERPGVLVKKVDSLLRGNLAAEIAPLLSPQTITIICPALPELGRVVIDGVVRIGDVPLHRTELWRAEAGDPPRSVAAALHPLPCHLVDLQTVRGPYLAAHLRRARGHAVICDAVTTADLERITDAALALTPVTVVGAAAACRALVRGRSQPLPGVPPREARPCLTVVGTASPTAAAQTAHLVAGTNPRVLAWSVADLLQRDHADAAADLDAALAVGDVLVRVVESPSQEREGTPGPVLVAALAERIRRCRVGRRGGRGVDLVLTGGETARSVLAALGVTTIEVRHVVHPGAVISTTDSGDVVATRPGSFGDATSLLEIRRAIAAASQAQQIGTQ
jgi:uncharacterized protein YgbK (DUF1537 family)